MPECAFCPSTAKLSGEHIWSEWMRSLFPSKRFRFLRHNDQGSTARTWFLPGIDLTANVVCESCNNGWMSNLESKHAKPALAELIIGKNGAEITSSRALAISRFAFKTAVIVDHMTRGESFYARTVRHHFARSLSIPRNTQMWFAGYLPMGTGALYGEYHSGILVTGASLELYVCTYAVGHFSFQVVSADIPPGMPSFECISGFEHLAIPLWPSVPHEGRQWPPNDVIRTRQRFRDFSLRWKTIRFVN